MTAFLSPLIPLVAEFAAAVLFAILSGVGYRLIQWLRLGSDSRIRAYLIETLERAVELAEARMIRSIAAGAVPGEAEWREAGAEAARYVRDRVPDALKHFGVTPQGLAEMVEARLLPRR